MRKPAGQFALAPGMGSHNPTHAPQLVQNGDNVAITASIDSQSWTSERINIYCVIYDRRNKLGMTLAPPFRSPARDFVARSTGSLAMFRPWRPDRMCPLPPQEVIGGIKA